MSNHFLSTAAAALVMLAAGPFSAHAAEKPLKKFSSNDRSVVIYTSAESSQQRLGKSGTVTLATGHPLTEAETSIFIDPDKRYQSLIGGLRSFDLIWTTTQGGPGFASDVIASVIYKQYQAGFYGLSTAGNVILFIVVTAIIYPLSRWLNSKEVAQ